MQRYGISDLKNISNSSERNVTHILKKYPDLLTSLSSLRCYDTYKLKCEGRILRRDTERIKRIKRFRRQPSLRLKQFESAFFVAMENQTALFSCPICRNILRAPITVECGHTFCSDCLDLINNNKCAICAMDVGHKRCINVLVQDLVEKWRDRNRDTTNLDVLIPNTEDILGVEPRYHLRSGYAGLQIRNEIENNITNFLYESTGNIPRNRCEQRIFGCKVYDEDKIDVCNFQLALNNVFKEVEDIKEKALKTSWSAITVTDLECILCSRCILDPVTTACGHTFCRGCLTRVLDHGLSCPLCMASLNMSDYSRLTTQILDQAIRFLVPKEYNERITNSRIENLILEKSSDVPVFICTNAFPGVACPLYVYEPRYRLLARRCLQSPSKRFAMAGPESSGDKFVSYGTILEVKDAVTLEDGRFILTTVGVRRFKVINKDEQDGYDTAKVQYIKDASVPTERLPELTALHQKVRNKASKWISSLRPKVLAEVERLIGRMPVVESNWSNLPDGPSWTWWLMPILPLSSQLQVGFLSTTNLEKRLRAIDKMLDHMKIRMKALERNSVTCPHSEDNLDSCGDTDDTFDMEFNEH